MATFQQLREGVSDAWGGLMEGWQRLYRRATGAITRFTPRNQTAGDVTVREDRELSLRSAGWGLLAAEVYDDDEKVVVRIEAPGMERKDFDLQVVENYLVVRGEKQLESERTEGRYHVSECAYGAFERAIPLPEEVDSSGARASYKKGVLRITLPKAASRRSRKVTVAVG